MKEAGKVIDQQLKSSLIPAGQTNTESTSRRTDSSACSGSGREHEYAINTLFTLLEDAFPLKFRRAFPTAEDQARAKSVWLQSLREFSPRRILRAARKAIDTTRFFPDLADIRELCKLRFDEYGLKEPLQAYYEACNAPSRSRDYGWSHLAVYLAARETGWFMIRGEPQQTAFPVFERNYEILCNRVLDGDDLEADIDRALENTLDRSGIVCAEQAARKQQQALMKEQGIDPKGGRAVFLSVKDKLSGS